MTHTMLSSGNLKLRIEGVSGMATLTWEFWALCTDKGLSKAHVEASIATPSGGIIHGRHARWPDIQDSEIQATAAALAIGEDKETMRTLVRLVRDAMGLKLGEWGRS